MLDADKLAAVKLYMRVDGDEDDSIISSMYAAAEQYLKKAGAVQTSENSELYTLCVHALTLHYYDNRDNVDSEASFPLGVRPIITQLKLTANIE